MSKRKVVHSEGRAIIAKVFHFLQEEYNFMKVNNSDKCDLSPLANVLKRTAEATGVSERTVTRILKEEKELPSPSSKFTSPMKKRRKRDSKFMLDNMHREVIRTTIQNFHISHKQVPTLAKLQSVLREKIGFDGCLSTLRSLLIEMGYKWKKIDNNRKSLQERHEIQLWRFNFLKKINQYRSEGRHIVYTDETYVLTSHVRQNTWCLKSKDPTKKDTSFSKKLSTGSRFIIVHAGNSSGFIKDASLVYKAASTTGDYHSNMNFDNYVKWLNEKLLPNIPEKSVIVMDNASYHNTRSSKIPTSNSCKSDMKKWLMENNIPFDERSRNIELYDLIKKNKERFVTYKIDEIIKSKGCEILRLPPYHPELNAIENIWGILKNRIASKNIAQNMTEVQNLIFEGLNSIDSNTWLNTCNHVEKIEKEYMKYFDSDFEFVINVGESSDSGTDEFESNSDSLNEDD
ncbi:uncharacterized protein LOC123879202 [Maniola jurtina]|uniref:uncharacterized protein LOC123868024 n=1 Tax=Maniola jurtina TaxID=191418 RepID=UPI001E686D61|nr:uncharacterized protein LOC123868024 [Maniola jurtina]XP_045778526.1 uncharacterized protein LOC123876343 [Maniola jurtina]XP_045781877.1 uncharacterized protein LOC123878618 [Maniola jurtina]XP_045782215.1 uncharacterized protein LOC123878881 [Maniola jurtina]XP_045782763.1 uncharacterized protein LOC123879202 [Maniola jurtina]